MVAKVKNFIKRKINTKENKIKSLKAEIYDLNEKIAILKLKNKADNEILNKIKNLSREDKKKFYELIGVKEK